MKRVKRKAKGKQRIRGTAEFDMNSLPTPLDQLRLPKELGSNECDENQGGQNLGKVLTSSLLALNARCLLGLTNSRRSWASPEHV